MTDFIDITLDKPLPSSILLPAGEGSVLFYLNAFTLFHIINNPTASEIKAFREDEFEIKAIVLDSVIFFCYRVLRPKKSKGFKVMQDYSEVVQWQEVPYWPNKTPVDVYEEMGGLSDKDFHLLFNFILVDYRTKVVKAIRAVTASPFFSKSFCQMCIDNHGVNTYEQNSTKTDKLYNNYPLGDIAKLAKVSTRGGM